MVLLTDIISDTEKDVGKKINKAYKWLEDQTPNIIKNSLMIILALIIFIVGKKLISLLIKIINNGLKKVSIDDGVRKFLCSFIKIILHIILIILIAGGFGIETSTFAAVIGSAGLAIGLSLQGSLSNFAGGVIILTLKPFRIGDYVSTNSTEGTVTHIDIFYTRITTVDNKVAVIPNGTLSNSVITNFTSLPDRRIDITVGVDYSQNINKVREVLTRIANENEMVSKDHPIEVFVNSFDNSAVSVGYRIWTAKENYWKVRFEILESIRNEFEKESIAIPFDQLDVHLKNES